MIKVSKEMRAVYQAPLVEVIEVTVENGIAGSGPKGTNNPNDYEFGGGAL